MDEFELIRRYFVRPDDGAGVVTGIGDDGAVLRPPTGVDLITVIDTLVEGVHFPANVSDLDAQSVGHRAVAVNLSDIAAMGGRPLWMTLALTLREADEEWLNFFATGLHQVAADYGVQLVGGDTTSGSQTVVSVQITGAVEAGQAITRTGAQPGDAIYVSGSTGDAAGGLYLCDHPPASFLGPHEYLCGRLEYPTPRLALGQALVGTATAAIDVSDGLYADLGKLLSASGVGGDLDLDGLPLSTALKATFDAGMQRRLALSGGDDYELCFTAAPGAVEDISADVDITRIGTVTTEPGLRCLEAGQVVPYSDAGYRHFA